MNIKSAQKTLTLLVSSIVLPIALIGCGASTAQTNANNQPSNSYSPPKTSVSEPAASPQTPVEAAVARGLTVFNSKCIGCHGANGSGGKAPSLIGKTPTASFIQTKMPRNNPGTLSSEQASDLVAYITSLK